MDERPGAGEYHAVYASYIGRVPAGDLHRVLERQHDETAALLRSVPADRHEHRYAPGKWSVKEVVGHLADVERVMAYRALRIARGDATPLAGFDENAYVPAGGFGRRSLEELVSELGAVRRATLSLLAGLPAEAWTRRGLANGAAVTVRALGCIIAGHELHHRAILETRYLAGSPA